MVNKLILLLFKVYFLYLLFLQNLFEYLSNHAEFVHNFTYLFVTWADSRQTSDRVGSDWFEVWATSLPFLGKPNKAMLARSAKIIWDSLMRRAEQQLTRVKVDIIRCHSHFLPKTQWKCFPPPSPPVSSCLFPPEGDGGGKKKRCSFLMRLDWGAFNGH